MSQKATIARHIAIIKKLRRTPASFEEVNNLLEEASAIKDMNLTISERTFHRDRQDIRSIYNIDIGYDFSGRKYYIEEDDDSGLSDKVFEAFEIGTALNLSYNLSGYIHFEKRKPTGTENLYGILHAIKNHFRIKFLYQKYDGSDSTIREVEPYALKEFRNRWYVLSKDLKDDKLKVFGLDRLSALDISRVHFNYPRDFDVNEFYRHCFGVMSPYDSQKPEEIELSFSPFQGKYIKSLPLHHSQQIITDNGNELRIKMKLYITHDLKMEILSFGESVEVIKPESLRKGMKASLLKAISHYETK
ncbi:MAG: helix-turn-helix transcriptional regulator [Bacteroidota bacterium]